MIGSKGMGEGGRLEGLIKVGQDWVVGSNERRRQGHDDEQENEDAPGQCDLMFAKKIPEKLPGATLGVVFNKRRGGGYDRLAHYFEFP
jgi:hypothetical protein